MIYNFSIEDINPEPWTAPEASIGRRNGKLHVNVYKLPNLENYQQAIRESLLGDYSDFTPINANLSLTVLLWRQLAAYEGDTRKAHRNRADATNLQKSLEDALQGILFMNDRQVIHAQTWVMEQTEHTRPLILITIDDDPKFPAIPRLSQLKSKPPALDNTHPVPPDVF